MLRKWCRRLALGMAIATAALAQNKGIEGIWQGSIEVNGVKLRLAFHISKNEQGALATKWDSLDQGLTAMPVRATTFEGGKLQLAINAATKFEGTMSADGATIEGTFTQGASLPLTLKRVDKVEELKRPQTPKPPFPYKSDDVTYVNKAAGITLGATLTIPAGAGPFPAAVLITGSGPQDRDETILGHKPFWVIADYLSRRGIAVLRVDDRGMGKSTGSSTLATLDDMTGDVLTGIEYLKGRPEIDAKHLGVIGHSEGGIVGPLAASRSADISFVVMLGGTAASGEQVLYQQGDAVMRSEGAGAAQVANNRKIQSTMFDVLRANQTESRPALIAKLREAMGKLLTETSPNLTAEQRAAAMQAMNAQFSMITAPEMRSFLFYDPAETLRKLKMPVLAINGSSDVQVLPAQNLPAIATALTAGGNGDFAIVELPGLNHMFQKCKLCSPAEYGILEETFSPDALRVMGNWLERHTKPAE